MASRCVEQSVLLNLVVLRTVDLNRASTFYSAVGLQFTEEQHGSGPKHLSAFIGDVILELYPALEGRDRSDIRIGFRVNDVRAACAIALINGGTLISEPKEGSWGLRCVIADPDGHRIELTQAP